MPRREAGLLHAGRVGFRRTRRRHRAQPPAQPRIDWGGWYDHVAPYRIGQSNGWEAGYTYGFRVPLLVVSAYTPAGYVNNKDHDFGSIRRFIEENFGLAFIGPGDYADSYANDLSLFFSLASPRTFTTIASPKGASYFLNRHGPALPLDDD